jgi:PRC-barrel domain
MRLSELIGSEVRDGNGVVIGTLRDVRLVQDGPDVDGFGRAFRIKGVLVGGPSMGAARHDARRRQRTENL